MQNIMRRPYRERFRLIIAELGTGLAGRPEDLQQVLKRADPGLRETIEGPRDPRPPEPDHQELHHQLRHGRRRSSRRRRRTSPRGWRRPARPPRSRPPPAALREQWKQFPRFLAELQPTMAQLEPARRRADRRCSRQVRQTTPQLKQFFADLGPFSEASRPSLKTLGQASVIGNKAFKASQAGDRRAERRRRERAVGREADAPVPAVLRRPQPLRSSDDRARQGHGSGRRPDPGLQGRPGLHRLRVDPRTTCTGRRWRSTPSTSSATSCASRSSSARARCSRPDVDDVEQATCSPSATLARARTSPA